MEYYFDDIIKWLKIRESKTRVEVEVKNKRKTTEDTTQVQEMRQHRTKDIKYKTRINTNSTPIILP